LVFERSSAVGDKRIGDLNLGWFVVSTVILLALALLIFIPLSRNMKTVDETSELKKNVESLDKKVHELNERVREIDVLRGQVEASHTASPEQNPKQKKQ
jgi:hypothetical protein